jgi:hypothetical protein
VMFLTLGGTLFSGNRVQVLDTVQVRGMDWNAASFTHDPILHLGFEVESPQLNLPPRSRFGLMLSVATSHEPEYPPL